jgi:catechol 2,3-dioxygenase-like lactoylglutathione lyase family enzyme
MTITHLDHLVLTVQNLQETCDFYAQVLGMEVVTFGENRLALKFGNQKINFHQAGEEIDPRATSPTPGSGDLCFITSLPLEVFMEHLRVLEVEIILGNVERTGAMGKMRSVYFRDPDGNLLEVANYNSLDKS